MSFSLPRRKAAMLGVAGAGLAVVMAGALAPSAHAAVTESPTVSARATAADWFSDPRTPAERRAELAVPKKPRKYDGPVRETQSVYRTRDGALAVPMRAAVGHAVVEGQAVTLDGDGLFVVNKTRLTAGARSQIRRLADSLADASSVRCEGYADYTGTAKGARANAAGRAAAVCDLLADTLPGLQAATTSYGGTWPAVLGGSSEDRRLNRRVVVEMTGTRPAAPVVPVVPPPVVPQVQVPGAPVLDLVDSQVGQITYRFTAPATDGGSPITAYEVSYGEGWEPVRAPGSILRPQTGCVASCYHGLEGILLDQPAGVSRDLQVRAVNRVGAGAPSNTLSAAAYGYPSPPTDLVVTGGDTALVVTFAAPASDGGSEILGYQISYDGGQHWSPVAGSGPDWSVDKTDLDNGTSYDVAVRAYNAWGFSEPATASALVARAPDAPWLEGEIDLDGTVAGLTFTSPQLDGLTDGGSPITGYELSVDGGHTYGSFAYTADPTEAGVFHFELADLTLGREYFVAVRAVNDRGAGARSKIRSFTPAVVPDAPTDVVATVSGTTVTLTFTVPASDGGAMITGYEVSTDDGPFVPATSGGPYNLPLTDQAPGAHTYQVRAVNLVGVSAAGTSNAVTVAAGPVPGAPTIAGYGYYGQGQQVVISFTPGAGNGATVTGYEMSVADGPWQASDSVQGGNQATFPCPSMACGWNYGSSVRLRAVTSDGGRSDASASYASNPIFRGALATRHP